MTTLTENNFAELLTTFGAACGTKERFEAGRLANENPPKLKNFDRFGHRTNEVEYHPSYHELMRFSMANGLHTSPWNSAPTGRLIARCAQNYMMTQVEAGHGCPITMTFAAVPALRGAGGAGGIQDTFHRIRLKKYPPMEKSACTVGMAVTEKQGVRCQSESNRCCKRQMVPID